MSDASPGNERFKQLLNELTEEHAPWLKFIYVRVSKCRRPQTGSFT